MENYNGEEDTGYSVFIVYARMINNYVSQHSENVKMWTRNNVMRNAERSYKTFNGNDLISRNEYTKII